MPTTAPKTEASEKKARYNKAAAEYHQAQEDAVAVEIELRKTRKALTKAKTEYMRARVALTMAGEWPEDGKGGDPE